jgi:hypothetical protein
LCYKIIAFDLDEALNYLQDALKILEQFRLIHGRNIIEKAIEDTEKEK